MTRVTITIHVDVPDEFRWVSVDACGTVSAHHGKPKPVHGEHAKIWADDGMNDPVFLDVVNWTETLTRVNGDRK